MPLPIAPRAHVGPSAADEEFTLTLRSVADGREVFLSGGPRDPLMVRPGLMGIDLPPVQIYADALPFDAGSQERGVRYVDRDIFVPLRVRSESYSAMRAIKLALFDHLDPTQTLVDVIVGQPNGKSVSCRGRYNGGAEGSYTIDEFGLEWQVLGLSFRCFDPYFYADQATSDSITVPAVGKGFLQQPFLPLIIRSSQVIGAPITVKNPGDAEAFAVWRFDGPFDSIHVTSTTSGRSWLITASKDIDEWIEVDTRLGKLTVRDQTGANLWGSVDTAEDDLFPLERGTNILTVAMTGTDDTTKASWSFFPRYRAA